MSVGTGPTRARTRQRRLAWVISLLAVGLGSVVLVGGCATTPASAPPTTSRAAPTKDASAAAAQYASNTPPASARMVCGEDVAGQVAGVLGVSSLAARPATWADHVYSCAYTLTTGRLILSVTITPSDAAARDVLQTMRSQLGADDAEAGLGVPAYSAAGTVVAEKDNMVLHVDATGLPDGLGSSQQRRIDVARLIAAGVLSCWTGA